MYQTTTCRENQRMHEYGMNALRKGKELEIKEAGGTCGNCWHAKGFKCLLKKKILHTLHQYCVQYKNGVTNAV